MLYSVLIISEYVLLCSFVCVWVGDVIIKIAVMLCMKNVIELTRSAKLFIEICFEILAQLVFLNELL